MADHDQQRALAYAFGAHLKSARNLLQMWKDGLSAERVAQLAGYEELGLRLGVSILVPKDRCIVQIFLLDAANQTRVLERFGNPVCFQA